MTLLSVENADLSAKTVARAHANEHEPTIAEAILLKEPVCAATLSPNKPRSNKSEWYYDQVFCFPPGTATHHVAEQMNFLRLRSIPHLGGHSTAASMTGMDGFSGGRGRRRKDILAAALRLNERTLRGTEPLHSPFRHIFS
jgi:hypothetical protein